MAKADEVKVSARLPKDLHKKAKLEAARREESMEGVIRLALESLLSNGSKVNYPKN